MHIDQPVSPFGKFKGQGWTFLLAPVSDSSHLAIKRFADHPGTDGTLVGGHGTLSLMRYHESPFGPYDEISYSPGSYEYLNVRNVRPEASARRITKCYVSCHTHQIALIRANYGIPAEQAKFVWTQTGRDEVTTAISLPNGEHIIDLTLSRTSLTSFTINTRSLMSNSIDLGKLGPIVQPLLDGNQVAIPRIIEPYSPLLESAPLLKWYISFYGNSATAKIVRVSTNPNLFPPIERARVSRIGLMYMDMVMTLNAPDVVVDVVTPRPRRRRGRICLALQEWFDGIIYRAG
jgi:hypothetical protein